MPQESNCTTGSLQAFSRRSVDIQYSNVDIVMKNLLVSNGTEISQLKFFFWVKSLSIRPKSCINGRLQLDYCIRTVDTDSLMDPVIST